MCVCVFTFRFSLAMVVLGFDCCCCCCFCCGSLRRRAEDCCRSIAGPSSAEGHPACSNIPSALGAGWDQQAEESPDVSGSPPRARASGCEIHSSLLPYPALQQGHRCPSPQPPPARPVSKVSHMSTYIAFEQHSKRTAKVSKNLLMLVKFSSMKGFRCFM